jgi:hypothetical protein
VITWLFDSTQRLKAVAAGIGVLIVTLMVSLLVIAAQGGSAAPAALPTPSGVEHTELVPPTEQEPTESPTPYVQPSQPIALEAVSAWLRYDLDDFGAVASPAALEAVSEAPRPAGGQEIEDSRVELGGPTRQTVQVDVTSGTIELVMVIDGERWVVQSLRYVA